MSQELLNLSNSFLNVSQIISDINIGFISLFSSNSNSTLSNISSVTRQIIIASLLETQNSFYLLYQTINPNYQPIVLTLDTLGKAFYEIYKSFDDVSSAFTQLFLQLLLNVNQSATAAYSQTSSDIQSITSSYQQSVISIKSIISNFNLLSIEFSSISEVITSINLLNVNNLILSNIFNAASESAIKISSEFNVFYVDFYIVSTTFIPGADVANELNIIPLSFSTLSIAFQEAYIVVSNLSSTPNPVSGNPLSISFNEVYLNLLNISNLFIQTNIQNSIYEYATPALNQILQISYSELANAFQFIVSPSSNSQFFNSLYNCYYIGKMISNIYNILISELKILYTYSSSLNNNIFDELYKYYQNASFAMETAVFSLNNIEFIINSTSTLKNILTLFQASLYFTGSSFLSIKDASSSNELFSILEKVNLYNNTIQNEFNLSIYSIMYPIVQGNVSYPVNSDVILQVFSNSFNTIAMYTKELAQEFENLFGVPDFQYTIQNQIFQNVINAYYILSEIYIETSINLYPNVSSQKFYINIYQIYNIYSIMSSLLSSLYSNINLSETAVIPSSLFLNIVTYFNNIGEVFNSMSSIVNSLDLPSENNDILSSCFVYIYNMNQNIFNSFNENIASIENIAPSKLITLLNIYTKRISEIWNIAFVSVYYPSNQISSLITPTSFSSSLSSASISCQNIADSLSAIQDIISLNPSNLLFSFEINTLNYNTLSYLFSSASNASSESELFNVFNQINSILLNDKNNYIINSIIFDIIPIRNIFPNNMNMLYAINNVVTNFNLFSNALSSASSSINILEFSINHPTDLSYSLAGASQAILEIISGFTEMITSLSGISQNSIDAFSQITQGVTDLSSSFKQAYASISDISAPTYNSVLAINAPFSYDIIPK